jgi:catechol 2,3-dioxygenase-like lactoylglutathione lyase family enzyme
MISRRGFLVLSGAAILAPASSWAEDQFPTVLDHIILGCNDLDRGIKFVEERTGIRAAFGGVHPDRGTMNALVSLGERHYLEIMAPNPNAKTVQAWAAPQLNALRELTSPRLVTWAVHPGDIEALAKKLRQAGVAVLGPSAGSRIRPDGLVLNWKSLNLTDNHHGLLPFFIEWSADSIHPSSDAPGGCHIERFAAADADPDQLLKAYQRIGVDVIVERGDRPQLRARISGPKGTLEVSS